MGLHLTREVPLQAVKAARLGERVRLACLGLCALHLVGVSACAKGQFVCVGCIILVQSRVFLWTRDRVVHFGHDHVSRCSRKCFFWRPLRPLVAEILVY